MYGKKREHELGEEWYHQVLNESHFSIAWTAPRWEKGHVRALEFRENRHGNNQSIDSGYKKIIKVVTWTAGLNK